MEFTLKDLFKVDAASAHRAYKNERKLAQANKVLHALATLERRTPNCKFRAKDIAHELDQTVQSVSYYLTVLHDADVVTREEIKGEPITIVEDRSYCEKPDLKREKTFIPSVAYYYIA